MAASQLRVRVQGSAEYINCITVDRGRPPSYVIAVERQKSTRKQELEEAVFLLASAGKVDKLLNWLLEVGDAVAPVVVLPASLKGDTRTEISRTVEKKFGDKCSTRTDGSGAHKRLCITLAGCLTAPPLQAPSEVAGTLDPSTTSSSGDSLSASVDKAASNGHSSPAATADAATAELPAQDAGSTAPDTTSAALAADSLDAHVAAAPQLTDEVQQLQEELQATVAENSQLRGQLLSSLKQHPTPDATPAAHSLPAATAAAVAEPSGQPVTAASAPAAKAAAVAQPGSQPVMTAPAKAASSPAEAVNGQEDVATLPAAASAVGEAAPDANGNTSTSAPSQADPAVQAASTAQQAFVQPLGVSGGSSEPAEAPAAGSNTEEDAPQVQTTAPIETTSGVEEDAGLAAAPAVVADAAGEAAAGAAAGAATEAVAELAAAEAAPDASLLGGTASTQDAATGDTAPAATADVAGDVATADVASDAAGTAGGAVGDAASEPTAAGIAEDALESVNGEMERALVEALGHPPASVLEASVQAVDGEMEKAWVEAVVAPASAGPEAAAAQETAAVASIAEIAMQSVNGEMERALVEALGHPPASALEASVQAVDGEMEKAWVEAVVAPASAGTEAAAAQETAAAASITGIAMQSVNGEMESALLKALGTDPQPSALEATMQGVDGVMEQAWLEAVVAPASTGLEIAASAAETADQGTHPVATWQTATDAAVGRDQPPADAPEIGNGSGASLSAAGVEGSAAAPRAADAQGNMTAEAVAAVAYAAGGAGVDGAGLLDPQGNMTGAAAAAVLVAAVAEEQERSPTPGGQGVATPATASPLQPPSTPPQAPAAAAAARQTPAVVTVAEITPVSPLKERRQPGHSQVMHEVEGEEEEGSGWQSYMDWLVSPAAGLVVLGAAATIGGAYILLRRRRYL